MIATTSSKLLAQLNNEDIATLAYLEDNIPLGNELAKLMKMLYDINMAKSREDKDSARSSFDNAMHVAKLKRSVELDSDELEAMEILEGSERRRAELMDRMDELRQYDTERKFLKSRIGPKSNEETPEEAREREIAARNYNNAKDSLERKAIRIALRRVLCI
jgi:hypothetical protein